MTNKEAIELLKRATMFEPTLENSDYPEAFDLAIKALEFAESQRLCCENCVNRNYKSKEVCTSPYGQCEFFEDKTQEGGAEC